MSWVMRQRIRLANWISGGELERWRDYRMELQDDLTKRYCYEAALLHIHSMRTPRCESIGKRMADVAAEALK